jgi:hypothetical protein
LVTYLEPVASHSLINQSMNESTNQSIHQPTNQSINQSAS